MSDPVSVRAEDVVASLRWRYAVKKFDATRRIPDATWRALEEALVLAPSSFGLQPWAFFVVENPELRQDLVAASWNQRQVVDASHLVVFAIKRGLGPADVERYIARTAHVRGLPASTFAGYQKAILAFLAKEGFDVDAWSARQLYIALGQFMTSAALLGVDTCPMEGLDPAAYDRILGLPALGYATYCACPAGYRSPDDKFALTPKVRFPASELIRRI